MRVSISRAQYNALMDIYGPPQDVHFMIMTASLGSDKWTLDGSEETFDSLLSTISEEIGEGLCTQKNARSLLSLCKKINPECLDWIGM